MKQGDYVCRISYGKDIIFRIVQIEGGIAILRGVEYRLIADAPIEDLEPATDPFRSRKTRFAAEQAKIADFRKQIARVKEQNRPSGSLFGDMGKKPVYFELPGKVLHLDGDAGYLRKSMDYYKQNKVPVDGYYVEESGMADKLYQLLPIAKPDILVLTGHDGIHKSSRSRDGMHSLGNYKNSHHFAQAVRVARQYERSLDTLVIIAGACQSHFEALLQAGANFASSPARILIHALDPVQIATKVSFTSIRNTVDITDISEHTISGWRGMGGIETRGCYRVGMPSMTAETESMPNQFYAQP